MGIIAIVAIRPNMAITCITGIIAITAIIVILVIITIVFGKENAIRGNNQSTVCQ